MVFVFLIAISIVFCFWRQGEKNVPDYGKLREPDSGKNSVRQLPLSQNQPWPSVSYQKPPESETIKFPIFNYHHIRPMPPETAPINERSFTVTPQIFEEHLKYFQENGYQVVLAEELLNYFDSGQPLPPKAAAITFDDGRYGQYEFAFPLLKKYGVKATFFITTDWVGKKDFMTWAQIKEMSDNGMIIGSHAVTHPHLAELSDEKLKQELEESKKILAEKIGPLRRSDSEASQLADLLAYPGGNYSDRVIEFTKNAGYRGAFGVYKIIDQSPKYRYSIRRFHADDNLESIASKLMKY